MKQVFFFASIFLLIGMMGHAQSNIGRISLYTQTNLPMSKNDNVIPSVGGSFGTSYLLNTSGEVMSSVSLEFGLLRSRVQSSPVNGQQRLTDYNLKLLTMGSSFLVAFYLDPKELFSLGIGAGVEYAFSRFSEGVLETTIFDVKGEEILSYSDQSKWGDPENKLRGLLSLHLKHHFIFGNNQMTLGPYYHYGSVIMGDYENEVSSSKFGIQIELKL